MVSGVSGCAAGEESGEPGRESGVGCAAGKKAGEITIQPGALFGAERRGRGMTGTVSTGGWRFRSGKHFLQLLDGVAARPRDERFTGLLFVFVNAQCFFDDGGNFLGVDAWKISRAMPCSSSMPPPSTT